MQTNQWYIDSWDPLAGLAFISEREEGLGVYSGIDILSYFIYPPNFQPESITDRALSFSAGRGHFQLGVFFDGREVGFTSLKEAIAFVRRTYISGSMGHYGGEGSPSPVPVAPLNPQGSMELFKILHERAKGHTSNNTYKDKFQLFSNKITAATNNSQPEECDWLTTDRTNSHRDIFELLNYAGKTLLIELLSRGLGSDDASYEIKWANSFNSLLHILESTNTLSIIDWIVHKPEYQQVSSRLPSWVTTNILDVHNFLMWSEKFRWPFPTIVHTNKSDDPFFDLELIPIPEDTRFISLHPTPSNQSLASLLSAWIGGLSNNGEPIGLTPPTDCEQAILLLCAVHITTPKTRNNLFLSIAQQSSVAAMIINQRVDKAWTWLASQLPSHAFPKHVEVIIGSAPRLLSKLSPTPTSSSPLSTHSDDSNPENTASEHPSQLNDNKLSPEKGELQQPKQTIDKKDSTNSKSEDLYQQQVHLSSGY
jgi:hypothetical protein